ncbi:cyclodehydratase [Mycolicibacterium phlei]
MTRYAVNPATPVLLRPDGVVQLGWDPRRAVMIRPPAGLTATTLAALLRTLQTGASAPALRERAPDVDPEVLQDLLDSLVDAGVLSTGPGPRRRSPVVRIHGRGPLSDLMAGALRCSGARITHSNRTHAGPPPGPADLVVLADYLVADPRVVRDLHEAGVAHLPVRVRDGVGLVGPLVIPGATSCLSCADLHRSDRDAAWPAVAAQLLNTVGHADRATLLATAALALNQVERVLRAVAAGRDVSSGEDPPPTLDTTLEFDVNVGAVVARRWARHPRCPC